MKHRNRGPFTLALIERYRHEGRDSPQPGAIERGIYAHRVIGGDRHHRRVDRAVVAGRAESARGRQSSQVLQQSQTVVISLSYLSRHGASVSAGRPGAAQRAKLAESGLDGQQRHLAGIHAPANGTRKSFQRDSQFISASLRLDGGGRTGGGPADFTSIWTLSQRRLEVGGAHQQ